MADFTKLAATAKRLIDKNARTVSFVRLSETSDTPAEPWRGADNPRTTPVETVVTKCTFVEPSSAVQLGLLMLTEEMVKRSDQIGLIPALDFTGTQPNKFDEVVDGANRWKIVEVRTLQPANTAILHIVGFRR